LLPLELTFALSCFFFVFWNFACNVFLCFEL
ncbi:hypothetical protein CFOL_v3_35499, partial [Cephalotus follicularis]